MHGVGIVKGKDGFVIYEGGFKNGKRHGKGRMATRRGVVYVGGWENGMREGHGVEKNATNLLGVKRASSVVGHYGVMAIFQGRGAYKQQDE